MKKRLNAAHKPSASVTRKKVDEKIEISVGDNGIGLPLHALDKFSSHALLPTPPMKVGKGLSVNYHIIAS